MAALQEQAQAQAQAQLLLAGGRAGAGGAGGGAACCVLLRYSAHQGARAPVPNELLLSAITAIPAQQFAVMCIAMEQATSHRKGHKNAPRPNALRQIASALWRPELVQILPI